MSNNATNNTTNTKMTTKRVGEPRKRGFASMDPQQQRQIASVGGRAAHESGNAHQFDSAEAREAGRKGGEVVSQNRSHMAEIGRAGGTARAANLQEKRLQKEREEEARREAAARASSTTETTAVEPEAKPAAEREPVRREG